MRGGHSQEGDTSVHPGGNGSMSDLAVAVELSCPNTTAAISHQSSHLPPDMTPTNETATGSPRGGRHGSRAAGGGWRRGPIVAKLRQHNGQEARRRGVIEGADEATNDSVALPGNQRTEAEQRIAQERENSYQPMGGRRNRQSRVRGEEFRRRLAVRGVLREPTNCKRRRSGGTTPLKHRS